MAPPTEATLPATRRARKSIGADVRRTRDRENATLDLGTNLAASRKKSRSKSLGPGGLDALRQGSGNRRASLAASAQPPRSILKPAPLPEIPPLSKKGSRHTNKLDISGQHSDELSGSKIALRTEEEQQEAARQRAERDRRDARRKSLANRRVSFAAEATLHTFHEVDFQQEPKPPSDRPRRTSSSARPQDQDAFDSRNNRRSSAIGHHNNRDDDTSNSFYTSDSESADEVEEEIVEEEEINSSDSDDGTMMTVMTADMTGTSMGSEQTDVYGDDGSSTLDQALRMATQRAGTQDTRQLVSDEEDEEEEIIPSFGWIKKGNQQVAGGKQQTIAPALRDEPTVNMGEDTEMSMGMDMDMTNAVGQILKSYRQQSPEQEEEMTMDVTRVYGGIVNQHKAPWDIELDIDQDEEAPMEEATMEFTTAIGGIHKPQKNTNDDDFDDNEEMSMELTAIVREVLGKHQGGEPETLRQSTMDRWPETGDATSHMDMDMDMTMGVGRILSNSGTQPMAEDDGDATMGMEMTTAIGGILSNPLVDDEVDETVGMEMTMGMEMTTAIGGIVRSSNDATIDMRKQMQSGATKSDIPIQTNVSTGRQMMMSPEILSSPLGSSPIKSSPFKELAPPVEPQRESPVLYEFTGSGLRRSLSHRRSEALIDFGTDSRTPSPAKLATPQLATRSPKSPIRAGSAALRSISRSASPKRPATIANITIGTPSSARANAAASLLFQNPSDTGQRTPTVILTPRKLTGVGLDRSGLGSPRVTELLERRGSIGDKATEFVSGRHTVTFQDPQKMTIEIDKERQQEKEKENQRIAFGREADGAEATSNLREMIDALSPKRNPLRGRKSLHVGSARGLLGKHYISSEDEGEESEKQDGVKRLKGHQGSPVKNVRLQQPPSKLETTGGRNLMEQFAKPSTPSLESPVKNGRQESPRRQARFKDVQEGPSSRAMSEEQVSSALEELSRDTDDERIQLQEFLNMTSIRFMELNTTKRRHTAAPASFKTGVMEDDEDEVSLERCVVTGACTIPTLELYQHSCRELKKYISEGRRIVKEIETDTFEENPPLFKEYMTATTDVKALMDNQFKNVKAHARLLSKAMWYEWRMKLQEGLKEGLVKIRDGMKEDSENLKIQEDLLGKIVPSLEERHEALLEESRNLEEVAKEMADCDPEDLESARAELAGLDVDILKKKRLISELRQQYEESEADVEALLARKQECLSDIQQSETIREECRGWTSLEIDTIKARVNSIEKQHGWAITRISNTTISMTYKREIEMVFDVSSLQQQGINSNIDLWYVADGREHSPIPKTSEKEFFLQSIRDHIRSLPHNRTPVSKLLRIVQTGWDKATRVSSQVRRVNYTFPTTVSKTSDSSVAITSSLLLGPLETRVETILNLHGRSGPEGIDVVIVPEARVVYGETFNIAKIGEFLATRIGERVSTGDEEWRDIVMELHGRLIARGRKQ